MLSDSLKAYLQDCQSLGLDFSQVSQQLEKSGYSPEQISLARDWYSPSPPLAPVVPASTPVQQVVAAPAQPEPVKVHFSVIPLAILAVVLLLLSGLGTGAYLVAADKIPVSNPGLKNTVSNIVFSLPFLPKTPRYILTKAGLAHQHVSKNSLDISLAIKSGDVQTLVGSNEMDFQIKGYSDFTDPKNPRASLNVALTKQLNVDFRKNDKVAYLKVNQIPSVVYLFTGLDPDKVQPLLANWIAWDTSPLDTQAQKELSQLNTPVSQTNQAMTKAAQDLLDNDILPAVVLTSTQLDGTPVYQLELKPTPQLLDKIGDLVQKNINSQSIVPQTFVANPTPAPKLSTYIKNMDLVLLVDQKDYYVKKSSLIFSVVPQSSTSTLPYFSPQSQAEVALVVSLSDFGKDIPIQTPAQSLTPEKFYSLLSQQLGSATSSGGLFAGLSPARQFAEANNTKRRSDVNAILNATYQYTVDNKGQLPPGITSTANPISSSGVSLCRYIIPAYMAALPVDPLTNSGLAVTNCTGTYNTGYTISMSPTTRRVTVSAPAAELGAMISVTR